MTTCNQCGLPVTWKRVKGRMQCYNPDGTVHWDRCSAERFAAVKRDGRFFTRAGADGRPVAEGYATKDRVQYTMLRPDTPTTGKHYRPDGCTCGLPPWEVCKPDCQHAIGAPREVPS